jgi:hypothetical protein
VDEAIAVFREDLKYHPRNPWALVGLIQALKTVQCCNSGKEIDVLQQQLVDQRKLPWADYEVLVACACCHHATI